MQEQPKKLPTNSFAMEEIIETNLKHHEILSSASLWMDEKFADATIVMGDRTWKVHRWVLCQQSKYFDRAFEGNFIEGIEKRIDLTGNPFTADNVHNLLKFMYTMDDKAFNGKRILDVYGVADYFMVDHLRYKALNCLYSFLQHNARRRYWHNFCTVALKVLEKYLVGDVHRVLIEVIANNVQSISWDTTTWLWKELKFVQPDIMQQVNKVRFPDQKGPRLESQLFQPIASAAGRATQAFDDLHPIPPIRSRSRSGSTHRQYLCDIYRSTPYKY